MRKLLTVFVSVLLLTGFSAEAQKKPKKSAARPSIVRPTVAVEMDLNVVKDDKLMVTVTPPKTKSETITYCIPRTVPGTYSTDDYGKFVDDLKAFDSKGIELAVIREGDNFWKISSANTLDKITYWVNDTFDVEYTHDIFSPAGTNINEGVNFLLNTHGFVGYFTEFLQTPYILNIKHPAALWGATSMTDIDKSATSDSFATTRYAELVENPIMYSKPDYTTFNINGMDIVISVYSPTGKYTAEMITPEMKTMMTAQKNFLGSFNSTKKYTVLLYLTDLRKKDAKGYGALEHPTATTVVMPELLPKKQMTEQLKDVVSHEFFHIVTPLTIHAKQIQDFDYNDPKMSEHLWMYEGVTEYFANLFQINQGLITEKEFFGRMKEKVRNASRMDDTMPFTEMSGNVLVKPYKDQYLNVYEKGALIGMCIDIIIREKSNGERGILDLMQRLSKEYGVNKAFDDAELFAKITALTYPEVGNFLKTYVSGNTPIPYADYFAKVGVTNYEFTDASKTAMKDAWLKK
jgi:predicted metalloprotease with PDZ domain